MRLAFSEGVTARLSGQMSSSLPKSSAWLLQGPAASVNHGEGASVRTYKAGTRQNQNDQVMRWPMRGTIREQFRIGLAFAYGAL